MVRTPEERYWEWLERSEIPMENWWDIDKFQRYMTEELGLPEPTRQTSLYGFTQEMTERLAYAGIYPVEFTRYGRTEQRWVIPGMRGLFGWEKVTEMFPELFE